MLFHVSADATWSNLPISGLFVDMLRRIAAESGAAARLDETDTRIDTPPALAPLRTLDGYGAMGAPPANAKPIGADFDGRASRDHPPGFYGAADAPVAAQALIAGDELRAMDYSTLGLRVGALQSGAPIDLRPALLAVVFLGLLVDWLVLLRIGGALRRRDARVAVGALCALVFLGAVAPRSAEAKDPPAAAASQRDRDAALTTRLAFVVSG
ncbi:MAG: LytTR family transcriptional regulator, partial [Methylocystaceae bacterium]